MKKLTSTLALAALVLTPTLAQAQAQATVNATVYKSIVVTATDNSIDFGTIGIGDAPTIDPNTTDATTAQFDITGQATQPVTITFDPTVTLSDGGTNSITFTSSAVGDANTANKSTAAALTSGNTRTLVDDGSGTNTGEYHVWVGGSLSNVVAAGTYTGTFTLTVAY